MYQTTGRQLDIRETDQEKKTARGSRFHMSDGGPPKRQTYLDEVHTCRPAVRGNTILG